MSRTRKNRDKILHMAVVAVFCALAYACQFVFRIHVSFLTFDAKDAIMAVGAMIFGPVWGVVMALVVSLLEFLCIFFNSSQMYLEKLQKFPRMSM